VQPALQHGVADDIDAAAKSELLYGVALWTSTVLMLIDSASAIALLL
jgi:hypothetical protein